MLRRASRWTPAQAPFPSAQRYRWAARKRGSTILLGVALTVGNGSAAFIRNNGFTLTVGGGGQTYAGAITGAGGLALTGGFLVLTSAQNAIVSGFPAPITTSNFSGNISVTGGTLEAGALGSSIGTNGVFGQCSNTRTATVNAGGVMLFLVPNVFGTNGSTKAPTLVINSGGLVTNMAPPGATGTNSVVNNALNNITLNGGTLSAATGEYNASGGYGSWDINGSVSCTANSLISSSDPVNGNVMLNATGGQTTFDVQSGSTLTVSAIVVDDRRNSGPAAGLNLTGSGLLLLTNSDSYSGATTVGGGTLQLGNGAAGNDGALTATSGVTNNSTLVYNLNGSQIASYAISGSGSLTKTGQGLLNLAGPNSYGGGTTVNSGTLQVGSAVAIPFGLGAGDVTVSTSGVLDLAGNLTNINGLWGGGIVDDSVGGGMLTVGNNGGASTFSGVIQNSNSSGNPLTLNIAGGKLTLSGTNTFAGGTNINAGILQFATTAAMPPSGTVAVAGSATLAVNAGGPGEFTNATSGSAGSISGLLAGIGGQELPVTWAANAILGIDATNAPGGLTYSGSIGDTGSGPLGLAVLGGTLTLSGSNTYTGGTDVLDRARLIVTSPQAIAGGSDLAVGSLSLLAELGTYLSPVTPAPQSAAAPSAAAPVPEPGAIALLGAAGLFLLLRRSPALINRG